MRQDPKASRLRNHPRRSKGQCLDSFHRLCELRIRASGLGGSGRYPTRVGVPRVLLPDSPTGLNADEMTLPEMLKPHGYRTACIGKWHLGDRSEHLPTRRGFDHYFGIPYSNDMNPPVLMRDTQIIEQEAVQSTLTARYTDEALKFIRADRNKPFFLYLPHTFPHIPLHASPRFRGKSPLGIYGDVVEELDWSVGEVLKALDTEGISEETYVFFSSDNGPWYQGGTGLTRGRKGDNWEGGVRVPLVAKGPGIAARRVCDDLCSTMDLLPTISQLAKVSAPPKPADGHDIWPLLSGARNQLPREPLLYFIENDLHCARQGKWKVHIARHNSYYYSPTPAEGRVSLFLPAPELYNLDLDPSESYDVSKENPAIVQSMLAAVERDMKTFPDSIRQAYAAMKERRMAATPAGAVPRPVK
ncbi:MAG: sulfatase-like hydrolase/transferase [Acidobacteriota bacterium]